MVKKFCYTIEIAYNKWSPFIISILLFIYHILKYFFPYDLTWFQYLCLPSAFTAFHMYNSRQTFMLCKTHRCFVNYVFGNLLACIAEHYWICPFMNLSWFIFIILGTLLAAFLGLYYYLQEHAKNNIRITKKDCR